MVANLVQSPGTVEENTGDVVNVVLHGQLAVQIEVLVSLDYRPTDLNWSKALWYSGEVDA